MENKETLSLPVEGVTCARSEEHTSELQSLRHLVCRLLLEKNLDPRVPNCLRVSNILFRITRGRTAHVAHGRTWLTCGHCTLRTVENVRPKTTFFKTKAKPTETHPLPPHHALRI